MKLFPVIFLAFIALTTSCIKKDKETEKVTPIIIKSSSSNDGSQPVEIPMHGTKENSSSGMENIHLKEQIHLNSAKKDSIK